MFGRLMNSFYYGKSGKGDYRKEDLPKNRWQLFWEMLRIRLSGLSVYAYTYFFAFRIRKKSDRHTAINSAAMMEYQIPETPRKNGRMMTAPVSKIMVRQKEITAETNPSLSAVKKDDA